MAYTWSNTLNSSKHIIVVDEIFNKTYHDANRVCHSICGDLYFPSTLKENNEVERVLDKKDNGVDITYVWLRITFDPIDGVWKDADYKENLNFTNFDDWSSKMPGANHAVMYSTGKWDYAPESYDTMSPHVLCEKTL